MAADDDDDDGGGGGDSPYLVRFQKTQFFARGLQLWINLPEKETATDIMGD